MKRPLMFVVLAMALGFGSLQAQTPNGNAVVKLDPALDQIISANAKLEFLKSDYFGLSEGPVWIREGQSGYLIFSDIGGNVIYKWTPDNKMSVFLEKSGFTGNPGELVGYVAISGHLLIVNAGSNGITVDPQGRVVFTAQGDRAIVRLEKDGKRTVLADHVDGKRMNRPNDLVVRSDGLVYYTDGYQANNPSMEIHESGVYRINKDGRVDAVAKNVPANGIAFSPDEKILYIGGQGQLIQYDVQPDGTLTNRRLFIDMTVDKAPGGADGMKVDRKGNVFTSGPGGIWIVSPQGKHLGTILLPETVTNLAFGDPDGKTLYITDRRTLAKIRLNAPGIMPGVPGS